jgi:hypothetical protein
MLGNFDVQSGDADVQYAGFQYVDLQSADALAVNPKNGSEESKGKS